MSHESDSGKDEGGKLTPESCSEVLKNFWGLSEVFIASATLPICPRIMFSPGAANYCC